MPQTTTEWVALGTVVISALNFLMLLSLNLAIYKERDYMKDWVDKRFVRLDVFRESTSSERNRERVSDGD